MAEQSPFAIETTALNLWYGDFQALFDVSLGVKAGHITSLIGPSGCGKSTYLRSINRIVERLGYVRTTGKIQVMGHDIYGPSVELTQVRKQIGMVFQRPNPLPLTITFVRPISARDTSRRGGNDTSARTGRAVTSAARSGCITA